MAKPLTEKQIVAWAESNGKTGDKASKAIGITNWKLTAWQLRQLGYGVEQVAQALEVSEGTVRRWDKQVKEKFAELPTNRIAIDIMQSLVPKAIGVYAKALDGTDMRIAKEAAKDILTNFKILIDRIVVEDNADLTVPDKQLIAESGKIVAEAERFIAQSPAAAPGD